MLITVPYFIISLEKHKIVLKILLQSCYVHLKLINY
jgi:hypothetical protein